MFTPTNRINAIFETLDNPHFRAGIWVFPKEALGKEVEIAYSVYAAAVDLSEIYLSTLTSNAKFAAIDVSRLLAAVNMVHDQGGMKRVLVYNVDLLLSGVTSSVRSVFWKTLLEGNAHQKRMLLFCVPTGAEMVLPQGSHRNAWISAKKWLE